tara:strand:- start:174 stop:566 length:393 start_codon:yes stop_codon:yes gene_type:complete
MSAPTQAFSSVDIEEAAATDDTFYVTPPYADGKEWYLRYATFTPHTTTAADATDYVTLKLANGSDSLGTLATSSVAYTAGTPRAFSLSGGKALEFTAGTDAVTISNTNTGTAGAAVHGHLGLCWEKLSTN